ncbi:abnormal spindle-like microcephaly-associated protein homolog [Bradysia coprophila]|uniref:abnormal spindle-like microcephaly-associated protein homolog n=1 Tax=Bradysia coprophila TaxID=38358 RepID=UPI00187DCFF5|nr:abnormal spindle-like microcephaly-associated protein homolog [Bradysia coprophila]
MNYLMFHQSGEGQFPKVPDGLKQLMSDISREVLREQPENIYEFVADYLEEMTIAREHKGIADNVLDIVIDDRLTIYEQFKECGISVEHAETSAKIIESYFNEFKRNKDRKCDDQGKPIKSREVILERDVCRKIMQACNLTREQDQQLRKIVQNCFKNFYFREKAYKLKMTRIPDAHSANRAEKTLDVYRKSAPEKSKLDKAAIVIQSAYRSYFVRKMPKEMQKFHECATKIQARYRGYMAEKQLQRAKAAAIKIQAMYRGYRTRKYLRSQKELELEPFTIASEIVNDIVIDSIFDEVESSDEIGTSKVTFDVSPEKDRAARTIQKVYRGFQEKRERDSTLETKMGNKWKMSLKKYDDSEIKQEILDIIEASQNSIPFE